MRKGNYRRQEIIESDREYNLLPSADIFHGLAKGIPPMVIAKSEGPFLYDINGRRYIDFETQYSTVRLGYGNKEMIDAMVESIRTVQLIGPKYLSVPRVELEELLAKITPRNLTKSWFGCNGTDANFLSVKAARIQTKKFNLLGNPAYELVKTISGITNVPYPRCYRCPYGLTYPDCDLACLKVVENTVDILSNTLAGIMTMAMASGPLGISCAPEGYLAGLRKICDERGLLLIFDEIATNFGITGKMFAYEHYNIAPDMLCLGKGLTSGYAPLSALIVSDKLAKTTEEYAYYYPTNVIGEIHTYTGYPLGCVAAITAINIIVRDKLCDNAAKVGEYVQKALRDLSEDSKIIGPMHGKGLYIHVDIVKEKKSMELDKEMATLIARKCIERGLIIAGDGGVIRLKPPININKEHADLAIQILSDTIREVQ